MSDYDCRFCRTPLRHTFVDLGMSPLCQTHIETEQLNAMEPFYPLRTFVCEKCSLVQLPEHVSPAAIFEEYAYFSSYSGALVTNAQNYVVSVSEQFKLSPKSFVIEIASNDGYLLQFFVNRGIPVLGIEPAKNVAQAAILKGVPSINEFFGSKVARRLVEEGRQADLLLGNNVLAHVPDLNDFVEGMKLLLKPTGIITMEFHYLVRLIDQNHFDSIYHEHFSYLCLTTAERVFHAHGLTVFDVEEVSTHGGSLRIYARHAGESGPSVTPAVTQLRQKEADWGVDRLSTYQGFGLRVAATKRRILEFLIRAKNEGKTIAAYGAPGKATTLLNYCGIRTDFLHYTVDRNPYKQGKYTAGTRVPILAPDRVRETRPDYLFILAWNLREEVMVENAFIREWGGKFVVPIPEIQVFD